MLSTAGRQAYRTFAAQIATIYGAESAHESFTVEAAPQQRLETKIQESSAFLGMINNVGVRDLKGETLGLGIGSTIAGRTNTAIGANNAGARRVGIDPTAMDQRTYECAKTNYDVAMKYAKIDAWSAFPDFQTRWRDVVNLRTALDIIMIGWNGTSVAANTNRVNNPKLQDVNKGWIQKLREEKPAAILSDGPSTGANAVKVGSDAAADYRNLDALVYDLIQLLDPWHQEDPSLRVITGRELMHDKYFPIFNGENSDKPSEQLAGQIVVSQKRIGGLEGMIVPFFPANALMITSLDNLSRYYQLGGRRRALKDEPEFDQITDYNSSNDAFVIEDLGRIAMVENIQLL